MSQLIKKLEHKSHSVMPRFFQLTKHCPLDLNRTPSFVYLQQLYKNRQVNITQIISPPRTGSTPLYFALGEQEQACCIFEPYLNRKKAITAEERLEHGARFIIDALPVFSANDSPAIVVTKEIAAYLLPVLPYFQEVVTNFIFLVNDPYEQMYSFLKMLANGREFGLKGLDGLPLVAEDGSIMMRSYPKMVELWPDVVGMLEKNNFKQTSWEYLLEAFQLVNEHCQQHPQKKRVIVESGLLRISPEMVLRKLTQELASFPFSPSMIGPWSKANGINFQHPNAPSYDPVGADGITNSMWVGSAVRSKRFHPPEPFRLHKFPQQVVNHILQVALPIYKDFMYHEAAILPPNVSMLHDILYSKIKSLNVKFAHDKPTFFQRNELLCFLEACPITAFTVIQAMINRNHDSLRPFLQKIQAKYPELYKAFQVMELPDQGNLKRMELSPGALK